MTPARDDSGGDTDVAADVALLERLAQGERDGPLIELYGRYGAQLYGFGMRLLRDSSLAEELVQETFVRLWRSATKYDPAQASPRTWILVLARRVAIDLRRRAATRPVGVGDAPLERLAAPDELDQAMLALDVRDALVQLSPPHREVLELGYHEGLTQRETAARLGIPLGTVKTRTYHALRELRVQLAELRLS